MLPAIPYGGHRFKAAIESTARCEYGDCGETHNLIRCADCLVWHCQAHPCDCPQAEPWACPNCGDNAGSPLQCTGEADALTGYRDEFDGCTLCFGKVLAEIDAGQLARTFHLDDSPVPSWLQEESEIERALRRAPMPALGKLLEIQRRGPLAISDSKQEVA